MDFSTLNVVWTLITLVGLLASSRTLWLSVGDYRYVKTNPTDVGKVDYTAKVAAARMAALSEFARWYIQAFFLSLGILAITTPPPSRILNNMIVGIFIAGAILLMVTSLVSNYERKVVLDTGEVK